MSFICESDGSGMDFHRIPFLVGQSVLQLVNSKVGGISEWDTRTFPVIFVSHWPTCCILFIWGTGLHATEAYIWNECVDLKCATWLCFSLVAFLRICVQTMEHFAPLRALGLQPHPFCAGGRKKNMLFEPSFLALGCDPGSPSDPHGPMGLEPRTSKSDYRCVYVRVVLVTPLSLRVAQGSSSLAVAFHLQQPVGWNKWNLKNWSSFHLQNTTHFMSSSVKSAAPTFGSPDIIGTPLSDILGLLVAKAAGMQGWEPLC